jgi:hypothetical protein
MGMQQNQRWRFLSKKRLDLALPQLCRNAEKFTVTLEINVFFSKPVSPDVNHTGNCKTRTAVMIEDCV